MSNEEKHKKQNIGIVLAGGSGSRMEGFDKPKQFLPLGQGTILSCSLQVFHDHDQIQKVIVVVPSVHVEEYRKEILSYGLNLFVDVIAGGKTRQASSYNAIAYIKEQGEADVVLVHDAARPFITQKMITESLLAVQKYGAAEVAIPVIDTIVKQKKGFVEEIPDRKQFYAVQTPQSFQFESIYNAHQQAMKDNFTQATDDVMLVARLGQKVKIIEGSPSNIKITYPIDYERAKGEADGFAGAR